MRQFFRVLRQYASPYKKYMAWAVVLNIFSAIFNIFSFTLIIPLLQILFKMDNKVYEFIPWDSGAPIKDMAFNTADGQLYALGADNTVYTIDLYTGVMTEQYTISIVGPTGTNEMGSTKSFNDENKKLLTLAIDDEGNFYSVNNGNSDGSRVYLYSWTAEDVQNGVITDLEPVNTAYDGNAGDMVYNDKVILSLFNALYYALASVVNSSITEDNADRHGSRSDALVHRFVAELGASCDKERSVEYYAKQLGVTPKYLSLVCKNKLGKNASKVIDGVVVNRAKELLMQPGVSIQEVAERLNFVSQSFFGKYFKQRTGVSPSRYKVQN